MVINQLKTTKGHCLVLLILAMACFAKGKGQIVRDYNYYYKQGYELGYKQKWKESAAMFDSALQLQPKNSDAYW